MIKYIRHFVCVAICSAMNIIKSVLHNKRGDQFMSDCLICYVEKDIFSTITNDDVIDLLKKMKDREGKL